MDQLLAYLLRWTQQYWASADVAVKETHAGRRVPSFSQVLDWSNLLLDANFTGILVRRSERVHTLLRALQHFSKSHLGLCEKLSSVKGLLATMQSYATSNKTITPSKPTPDYCVQVLAL